MPSSNHIWRPGSGAFVALTAILAATIVAALVGAAPASSEAVPAGAQSPIDFRKRQVVFVDGLPTIRFSYPRRIDLALVNTGSPDENATVRADVPPGAASITLRGAHYELLQFHWHTPSEHERDGRDTPMEMHFVHRRADGSLLVIGVFIERGGTNRAFEPIFRELPEHPGDTRRVPDVRLPALLPGTRSSFRYAGSLTTPPFTEGVQWIVLTKPVRLSKRQIGAFRELFEEGNSREVQPLNNRQVLSDARRNSLTPHSRE